MYGVRVATAALLTIFGAQTALAQARFYDWSGVYVGANAGYGSGSVTEIASGATTSSTETISGAVLGGHIGGNLQYQGLLLGAQLDGDWSNQRSSGGSINTKLTWLATARMRVGYAYDNIAYYVSAGAAYLPLTNSASSRTAWVAGIGQESALNRNLILRFEVIYLQLLPKSETLVGINSAATVEKMYDVIARVGLSYKFNWLGN
jgi:outer membrane immunogenic protein